jgi:hypothetical protein
LATGHFSGKFFPKFTGSGHAGSNDTGLKSVSRPGAEPIDCLIYAISEISKNCLIGNLPLKKSEIAKLKKYRKVLRFISGKNSLKKRKKIILQRGGFLNILIPSALYLLSEVFSKK